jgi:signal transduction histidine kinase
MSSLGRSAFIGTPPRRMHMGTRTSDPRVTVRDALNHERAARVALADELAALRHALEDAEGARARAERASDEKSRLLALISHDVRGPVGTIVGYASLLTEGVRGPMTQTQRADLQRIGSAAEHALGILSQILAYARLEVAQVTVHRRPIDLTTLLGDICARVHDAARDRRVMVGIDAPAPVIWIRADPDKLEHVLFNLASNAVAFTDAGGRVDLVCRVDDSEVEVVVRDTGTGIAAEHLERIFEPFVHMERQRPIASHPAAPARGAPGGGLGLGLTIARDLTRVMGGEIHVASKLGSGSAFTVRLPRW